jgi:hypothetical protein
MWIAFAVCDGGSKETLIGRAAHLRNGVRRQLLPHALAQPRAAGRRRRVDAALPRAGRRPRARAVGAVLDPGDVVVVDVPGDAGDG